MLCELSEYLDNSLIKLWICMNFIMLLSVTVISSTVFYFFYWAPNVTYEKWIYKVSAITSDTVLH